MLTIGARLKEERGRLGLTQPQLAGIASVSKTTQVNYEGDLREPDAGYLAAVAAAGIDVLYVLTGVSSPKVSGDEAELLRRYRAASAEVKSVVFAALGAVSFGQPTAPGMTFHGKTGQVIQGNPVQDGLTIHVGSKKGGAKK